MFSNLRSLIFKFDPETAHNLAIKSLKFNFVPSTLDNDKNNPLFKTKLFDKIPKKIKSKLLNQIPNKKLGNLNNINNVINTIIKSEYINGSTIHVDGGI